MSGREFGDYVHDLRIKKTVSLRNAAKEMDISAMYLSEIESGKKIPSGQMLKTIADYYGTSYFHLVVLANNSVETSEHSSRAAVARMVGGLSDEKIQKVMEYIQNMESEDL
ncbi:MAG: helix-turn-helix transcriptional regulator [Sphaerochaetaceae bacterium]|nr:helix-turn-helix transcriptional regulator [Sphaerochaetaceae bacterium]